MFYTFGTAAKTSAFILTISDAETLLKKIPKLNMLEPSYEETRRADGTIDGHSEEKCIL